MSMNDRDGFIWFNGELIEWRQAKIHSLTHGLHYASSVFEGERAYKGKIFKSVLHTQRLFASARYLDFTIPYTVQEIEEAKASVIKANALESSDICYVRAFAFLNSDTLGLLGSNIGVSTAIAAWEWKPHLGDHKSKGLRLAMAEYRRPSEKTIPSHAKAAGLYMICTISKNKATAQGYDDALMLDYRGYVAETTGANIFFFMKDGKLHTPKPDCFLNGITRQTVIDIARRMNIDVVERHMEPHEMQEAQECFVTGTAAEIVPVAEIADTYTFTPGNICGTIREAYHKLVRGL